VYIIIVIIIIVVAGDVIIVITMMMKKFIIVFFIFIMIIFISIIIMNISRMMYRKIIINYCSVLCSVGSYYSECSQKTMVVNCSMSRLFLGLSTIFVLPFFPEFQSNPIVTTAVLLRARRR